MSPEKLCRVMNFIFLTSFSITNNRFNNIKGSNINLVEQLNRNQGENMKLIKRVLILYYLNDSGMIYAIRLMFKQKKRILQKSMSNELK